MTPRRARIERGGLLNKLFFYSIRFFNRSKGSSIFEKGAMFVMLGSIGGKSCTSSENKHNREKKPEWGEDPLSVVEKNILWQYCIGKVKFRKVGK